MEEIQALAGALETVLEQIPDPDGAVGDDQHSLGLGHSANAGLGVELGPQILDTATRGSG